MITGLLPPSSRLTLFKLLLADASWIKRPVSVEPVKAILLTSKCLAREAPQVGPSPGTTLTTPFGKPASLHKAPIYKAVSGVSSAGFNTIVLPQAKAGPLVKVEFQLQFLTILNQ